MAKNDLTENLKKIFWDQNSWPKVLGAAEIKQTSFYADNLQLYIRLGGPRGSMVASLDRSLPPI